MACSAWAGPFASAAITRREKKRIFFFLPIVYFESYELPVGFARLFLEMNRPSPPVPFFLSLVVLSLQLHRSYFPLIIISYFLPSKRFLCCIVSFYPRQALAAKGFARPRTRFRNGFVPSENVYSRARCCLTTPTPK